MPLCCKIFQPVARKAECDLNLQVRGVMCAIAEVAMCCFIQVLQPVHRGQQSAVFAAVNVEDAAEYAAIGQFLEQYKRFTVSEVESGTSELGDYVVLPVCRLRADVRAQAVQEGCEAGIPLLNAF
jgi:hypothetical protein